MEHQSNEFAKTIDTTAYVTNTGSGYKAQIIELFVMYEPLVIRTPKPRSLRGTPAGRYHVISNLVKTLLSTGSFMWFGYYVVEKRRVIEELEGTMGSHKLKFANNSDSFNMSQWLEKLFKIC
ncbi:uncharacterized protein LOC144476531 [Augochlora pura]